MLPLFQAGLSCAWQGSSDTSTFRGPIDPGCAAALAPSIPECSESFPKFSTVSLVTQTLSIQTSVASPCAAQTLFQHPQPPRFMQPFALLPSFVEIAPPELLVNFCSQCQGFFNHAVQFLSQLQSQLFSVLKTVVFRFWGCKTLQRFVKACWYCPRAVTPWLGE